MGRLTTHILDTAQGRPAAGIPICLFALEPQRREIAHSISNQDGRVDDALLSGNAFQAGRYEIVFYVADYFRKCGLNLPEPAFLDDVVIRFGIADTTAHYHVPLLISPYGFSSYRGS